MLDALIQFQYISISGVVRCFGFFQSGSTALHYKNKCGFQEVLKFLVAKHASVNVQTDVHKN